MSRRLGFLVAVVLALGAAVPVTAHDPDPTLGDLFAQSKVLQYRWSSSGTPPYDMKIAIHDARDDANASRKAKSPTFDYDTGGSNVVYYGTDVPCGVNGLACFQRDPPGWFGMWFRENGHRFDWGTLRWCELAGSPDGCYDAENIALDEFGHVLGLGHHDNFADDSDYKDAVVQTYSRTKPKAGYNAHVFGRCDVATLQQQYDVLAVHDALQHLPRRADRLDARRLVEVRDVGRDGDVHRDAHLGRHRAAVEQPDVGANGRPPAALGERLGGRADDERRVGGRRVHREPHDPRVAGLPGPLPQAVERGRADRRLRDRLDHGVGVVLGAVPAVHPKRRPVSTREVPSMSRPVNAATVSGARRAAVIVGLVAAVLAGCGTGGLPATAPPSVAPATATASPPRRRRRPRRPADADTRRRSAQAALPEPPGATLSGIVSGAGRRDPRVVHLERRRIGRAVDRALGREPGGTGRGARRRVRTRGVARGLDGPLGARHGCGCRGRRERHSTASGRWRSSLPTEAGAWSLQLEARSGQGRSGTWYWRLEVGP